MGGGIRTSDGPEAGHNVPHIPRGLEFHVKHFSIVKVFLSLGRGTLINKEKSPRDLRARDGGCWRGIQLRKVCVGIPLYNFSPRM
jgi:hypothetical protein